MNYSETRNALVDTDENDPTNEMPENARENTENIAANILHENQNTEEAISTEIDPTININANQIEVIVKQVLSSKTTKEFTAQMSTEIAVQVRNSIIGILEKKKEVAKPDSTNDKYWQEHDDYYICTPCAIHHKRSDAPDDLKPSVKANFGVIKKSENKKKFHLKQSKKDHNKLGLHGWCVLQYENQKKEDISYEQSNVEAGKKVIKNALYCLQNSLSARNFVGLNAKDYTCYLENPATKNVSEKEFYKLMDIIFEALSEKTIRFFQENVKQISVTLDKVTGKSFQKHLFLHQLTHNMTKDC